MPQNGRTLTEPYGVLLALRTSGILCGRWVKWVAAVIEEHVLTVVLGRKEVLVPLLSSYAAHARRCGWGCG